MAGARYAAKPAVSQPAPEGRLEASGSFNALFTHRVRVTSAADIDQALTDIISDAEAHGWI
jgi:hypothetical protein